MQSKGRIYWMISTRKRCDDLSMISITRRMLSPSRGVVWDLSGGGGGGGTEETSLYTSLVYTLYTCACHNGIVTLATFFVVRVTCMAVEMYGKSWFACLQVWCYTWSDAERV